MALAFFIRRYINLRQRAAVLGAAFLEIGRSERETEILFPGLRRSLRATHHSPARRLAGFASEALVILFVLGIGAAVVFAGLTSLRTPGLPAGWHWLIPANLLAAIVVVWSYAALGSELLTNGSIAGPLESSAISSGPSKDPSIPALQRLFERLESRASPKAWKTVASIILAIALIGTIAIVARATDPRQSRRYWGIADISCLLRESNVPLESALPDNARQRLGLGDPRQRVIQEAPSGQSLRTMMGEQFFLRVEATNLEGKALDLRWSLGSIADDQDLGPLLIDQQALPVSVVVPSSSSSVDSFKVWIPYPRREGRFTGMFSLIDQQGNPIRGDTFRFEVSTVGKTQDRMQQRQRLPCRPPAAPETVTAGSS